MPILMLLQKQIYTFVKPDGPNVHIDSEGLRQWTLQAKPEVVEVPIDREIALGFLRDNVISSRRVMELMQGYTTLTPMIFAKDGTISVANGGPNVMLVDGHHRYACYAAVGLKFAPAHVLERAEWEPFRIEDEWLNTTEAGLKALPVTVRNY